MTLSRILDEMHRNPDWGINEAILSCQNRYKYLIALLKTNPEQLCISDFFPHPEVEVNTTLLVRLTLSKGCDPWRWEEGTGSTLEAGKAYADDVLDLIQYATPGRVAGFIAESIQGVGGTVVFPDGYLSHVYQHVREAGGICIADEVQTGFGRTGEAYWGFESQGVIPDMVTMAKGIGNGVPLGAVVTTAQIAKSLAERIHFNTFGGNPVVCAQARTVLQVIDRERLQQNALSVGNHLIHGFRELAKKHDLIGEVRGKGLMLGVELVRDRATKEPQKTSAPAYMK